MVCAAFLVKYLDLSLHRRAIITCQWFFTALSVRPGKSLAMVAHLFPCTRWEARRRSSSSSVKGLLLILGSNWLNHLNLQLFPASIVKQHLGYQPKDKIYLSNWNIPSYRTPLRIIEGTINKNTPIISTFSIRKKLVHLSSLVVTKVENWWVSIKNWCVYIHHFSKTNVTLHIYWTWSSWKFFRDGVPVVGAIFFNQFLELFILSWPPMASGTHLIVTEVEEVKNNEKSTTLARTKANRQRKIKRKKEN